MAEKDQSFQALRGICIVAVVAIHACGLTRTNDASEYGLSLLVRQFVNFAVPAFIFISGYFASSHSLSDGTKRIDYYRKRLTRVLVPYLIWCAVWIVVYRPDFHWHPTRIVTAVLTGQVVGPYYFVIVLVQLILLTPLMIRSVHNAFKNLLWLSLTPLSLLVLYALRLGLDVEVKSPWYMLPFTVWVGFYHLGIMASRGKFRLEKIPRWVLPLILVCGLAASVLEARTLLALNEKVFAESQIKASSFVTSFLFVACFLAFRHRVTTWPLWLLWLGDVSFGIYLLHMPLLDAVSQITHRVSWAWPIRFSIDVVSVVFTCALLVFTARKVFGNRWSQKYLGL